MSQMPLSLPPDVRSWINHRVAEGRYLNAGDYVRDLIRRDQDSFNKEPESITQNVIAGRHARRD